MPLEIVRNDITKMKVDVIVNSAHPTPEVGGGVDYAIHRAAGPELYCYKNSLRLAVENQCKSIAFPLISAGVFGCPAEIAIATAVQAIRAFLADHEINVYLVVFDRKAFKISNNLFDDVQDYLDKMYVEELMDEEETQRERRRRLYQEHMFLGDEAPEEAGAGAIASIASMGKTPSPKRLFKRSKERVDLAPDMLLAESAAPKKTRSLSDLLDEADDTFSEALIRLIDAKGKTDPEIYKRANVDHRHFAKIRKNPDYQPSKATALALAVALELNLDETKDFIGRAGYAISHSSKTDIIVEYFNETLFAFGQPCLG